MPSYTKGFTREVVIPAAVLGLNGVPLNVSTTSNTIDATGYNQLRLDTVWNRAGGGFTAVAFYIEHSRDQGTTWERLQTGSVTSGTEALSNHTVSKTVAASNNFPYILSIFYNWIRIVVSATAGAATDTATITATLGVSG